MAKTNYSADSIKVLHGLEGIRERPDMYIGSMTTGVSLQWRGQRTWR